MLPVGREGGSLSFGISFSPCSVFSLVLLFIEPELTNIYSNILSATLMMDAGWFDQLKTKLTTDG